MSLKLEHVFPGERMRAGKVEPDPFVDYCAVFFFESAVVRITRLWQFAENRLGTLAGLGAGNTDDTDASTSGSRSNGRNGFKKHIHGPTPGQPTDSKTPHEGAF